MRGAAPRRPKEDEHGHHTLQKLGSRTRQWLARYGWAGVRNLTLFCAGLLGVLHETLVADHRERPTLLLLYAAMMGLPVFLGGRNGGAK